MGKRGPKPKRTKNPEWSQKLAYACGLMASDGCLYSDGRHMCLTSQDIEQLETFKKCLGLTNKISWKPAGLKQGKPNLGSQVQFGDVTLYKWFISIGITPRKTHTIGAIKVPDEYFFDYLRGEFDGDGSSHAYWDTRWRSSVSLYIKIACASRPHLVWINNKIRNLLQVEGVIEKYKKKKPVESLTIAKTSAKEVYRAMYHSEAVPYLRRKKDKLDRQWRTLELAKLGERPPNLERDGKIITIT